jgi:asparagine synthase (glutamine-hydrolysing)
MCGIAGMIDISGRDLPDGSVLDRMVEALRARGPDDVGTSVHPRVAIGMRRLSIIDIESGHQPIANEDNSIEVVANGELYNYVELREELIGLGHRFRTASDTEVIVHGYEEWGLDGFLQRVEGMFAFALHDIRSSTVHIVRDRLGIKPLVYAQHGGVLYFSSTVPSLLASGRVPLEPDPLGVRLYLQQQFVPGPTTVVAGVRKVPPGGIVSVVAGRAADPRRYWSLPAPVSEVRSAAAWRETLLQLADDAVRKHMRADVDVGVLLSGGLDSSVVLGLMADLSERPIAAFTVGVAGSFDETPFARLATARFGATLHHTELTPAAFASTARDAIEHLTEPIGDPACVPLFQVARLARQHVKVVLTGEGADELFSGYGYYRRLASTRARTLQKIKRFVTRGERSASSGYPYVMSGAAISALTPSFASVPNLAHVTRALEAGWLDGATVDPINRAARIDINGFLADDLLAKVDSATMAHGLEARVPFLDHRMVEMALRIPGSLKRRGNVGKLIVRDTFRPLIGNELTDRSKHGFNVPLAEWFRGPLRPMLADMTDGDLDAAPWIDRGVVRRMVDRHVAGADHARELWTLYSLAAWYRAMGDPSRSASGGEGG